jgi:FMN-dependent NADH-azoreductase
MDHTSIHLTIMLGFIGISDVTFVDAEGTVSDLDAAPTGAQTQIDAIAA